MRSDPFLGMRDETSGIRRPAQPSRLSGPCRAGDRRRSGRSGAVMTPPRDRAVLRDPPRAGEAGFPGTPTTWGVNVSPLLGHRPAGRNQEFEGIPRGDLGGARRGRAGGGRRILNPATRKPVGAVALAHLQRAAGDGAGSVGGAPASGDRRSGRGEWSGVGAALTCSRAGGLQDGPGRGRAGRCDLDRPQEEWDWPGNGSRSPAAVRRTPAGDPLFSRRASLPGLVAGRGERRVG
jgi:hypothetical protein